MNRRKFIVNTGVTALLATSSGNSKTFSQKIEKGEKEKTMKIQRLAWAGIKVEVGQTTVFVDAKGDPTAPLKAETTSRFALITHHHGDHSDLQALKTILDDKSYLICHKDVAPWLDNRIVRLQTLNTFEPIILSRTTGDIVATPVPAVDGFGHPQVSWVIDGGGKRIIHCGDTLWHGYWWDIGRIYGGFDMAFLPINGFRQVSGRYTDTGIPMGLTPEQAVAAAKVLQARVVCPIHYGEPSANYFEVSEPEAKFVKAAKEAKIPVKILKPNEWIDWAEIEKD